MSVSLPCLRPRTRADGCSIWIMKICIVEFYMRLTDGLQPYGLWLRVLWWVIVATFCGVVLSTLLECRPFSE